MHADTERCRHVKKHAEDVRERQDAQMVFALSIGEIARNQIDIAADVAHRKHNAFRCTGRAGGVVDAAQIVHVAVGIADIVGTQACRMHFAENLLSASVEGIESVA